MYVPSGPSPLLPAPLDRSPMNILLSSNLLNTILGAYLPPQAVNLSPQEVSGEPSAVSSSFQTPTWHLEQVPGPPLQSPAVSVPVSGADVEGLPESSWPPRRVVTVRWGILQTPVWNPGVSFTGSAALSEAGATGLLCPPWIKHWSRAGGRPPGGEGTFGPQPAPGAGGTGLWGWCRTEEFCLTLAGPEWGVGGAAESALPFPTPPGPESPLPTLPAPGAPPSPTGQGAMLWEG